MRKSSLTKCYLLGSMLVLTVGVFNWCGPQYIWGPTALHEGATKLSSSPNSDLRATFQVLVKRGYQSNFSDTDMMYMLITAFRSKDRVGSENGTLDRDKHAVVENAKQLTKPVENHDFQIPRVGGKLIKRGTQQQTLPSEIARIARANKSKLKDHQISYPWNDVSNPINPHDYKLIINQPDLCKTNGSKEDVFLLVLVFSTAEDVKQRDQQRETCLSVSRVASGNVRYAFLLANPRNESVLDLIRNETRQHKDILMEDFTDSYRNLSRKTMMGMKWTSMYCPQAQFVMKADDNVYISLHNIATHLEKFTPKNFATGYLYKGRKPVRVKSNKWYLSEEEYPDKPFPRYLCGVGYMFSGDLAPRIFNASLSIPYLFLEDVFFGLCLEKINVVPSGSPGIWISLRKYDYCLFKKANVVHLRKPQELSKYWKDQNENQTDIKC